MKFFDNLKKGRSKASTPLARLTVLRLFELFQNIREYFSLVDDGKDKSSGEYILDFHYVSSLVENILGQMNMIVHSACILAPEDGGGLYSTLDRITKTAKERFINIDRKRISDSIQSGSGPDDPAEPEYVLLQQVLNWVDEGVPGSEPSCMHLLRNALQHVLESGMFKNVTCENVREVEFVNPGARNIVGVADLDQTPVDDDSAPGIALDAIQNGAFGLLALGGRIEVAVRDAEDLPVRRWRAFVESDTSNMILTDQDGRILLAVNRSGGPDEDFIFVLYSRENTAEKLQSTGFQTDKAEFGSMAYKFDAPVGKMDEYLTHVGSSLFGTIETDSLH